MSIIRTTLSIWNDVEIAIPGANRPMPQARSAWNGSSPSNSIESSPASSSSINSTLLMPLRRSCSRVLAAGSRPASRQRSSSLARSARRMHEPKLFPRSLGEPAYLIRPSTAASSSSVGTRRKSERPIATSGPRSARAGRCRRPAAASQPFLVARERSVPWKPMSPTQAAARSSVRAAVEVEAQVRDLHPEAAIGERDSRWAISAPGRVLGLGDRRGSCSGARRCRRSSCPATG